MWPMWRELTFGIVYGCVAVTCRLIFFAEPTISLNPPHPASSSQTTAINPRTTMSPDTSRIEKKLSHLNRRVQAILEQVGGSDKMERQEFLKELQRDVVSKSIADQNHLLTPPIQPSLVGFGINNGIRIPRLLISFNEELVDHLKEGRPINWSSISRDDPRLAEVDQPMGTVTPSRCKSSYKLWFFFSPFINFVLYCSAVSGATNRSKLPQSSSGNAE